MPTPEGIKHWKKKYDGSGDKKHWRTILQYKGNRGTLIHYNLLNEFEDGDMYSVDEEQSTEELKLEGDWSRYREDLTYAQEAWEQIKQVRGISDANVLNVECFVTNTGVGYAGQFDLLYVDEDSNVVLSDIKTSNADHAPYEKHKLQLTAYAHALELDVDILEVLIIHPDSQTWKISHDTDWTEDVDDLWAEFRELREGMGDVEDRMRSIADEGIDDAQDA
jgi:CRISPR/Cas system-associated exonuclease Cas4 (RecB family)